jgi:hypothetical protein
MKIGREKEKRLKKANVGQTGRAEEGEKELHKKTKQNMRRKLTKIK